MELLPDKRRLIYVLVFVPLTIILTIFLVGCGDSTESISEEQYKSISAGELKTMMENKDFTLINVHIPYAGDITGTDMSIPFNEIGERLDLPKDSRIVLYCRSGSMSQTATKKLAELGYTNVFDLKGGMIRWQQEGNEIDTTPDR
jgi:rhodanese-related sulfurtransferase